MTIELWIGLGVIVALVVWATTDSYKWAAVAGAIWGFALGLWYDIRPEPKPTDDGEPYDDSDEDEVEDVPDTSDDRPIDDYVLDVHRRGTEED